MSENKIFFSQYIVATLISIFSVVIAGYIIYEAVKIENNRARLAFEQAASLFSKHIQYRMSELIHNANELSVILSNFDKITPEIYHEFVTSSGKKDIRNSALVQICRMDFKALRDFETSFNATSAAPLNLRSYSKGKLLPLTRNKEDTFYVITNEIHENIDIIDLEGINLYTDEIFKSHLTRSALSSQSHAMPLTMDIFSKKLNTPALIVINGLFQQKDKSCSIAMIVFVEEILSNLSDMVNMEKIDYTIDSFHFDIKDNQSHYIEATDPSTINYHRTHDEKRIYESNFIAGNRKFHVVVHDKKDFFLPNIPAVYLISILAIFMALLVIYFVYFQVIRSKRVEALVEVRTKALRSAHQDLEEQNTRLQELNNELSETRYTAERANRAKSEFLATMSHELRTPLNSVLGFSEILKSESLGPINDSRYVDYADNIYESGQHLLTMINDILDLAKLETGRMEIQSNPIHLHDFVSSMTSLMMPQAENKSLALSSEIEDPMPEQIMADKKRLKQIVINLIGNAIKFTDHGHVKLTIKSFESQGGYSLLVMEVSDTGIGIPNSKIATLFERFNQVHSGFNREFGGTGLGLAICKELCLLMKGHIEVESEEGSGSTFRVILPLVEVTSEDIENMDNDFL